MDKVKIIQFGDMHFDTPFSELSKSEAEKRKEDLRETFGKIINLSKKEDVKIMLITGDLFDNMSVARVTLDYIIKMFQSISNIRIFISPGNHDPINERSFYKIMKWPDNVHIFENKMDKVIIQELNTIVYGIGFNKSHIENSLLRSFKIEDSSKINLMVIHGDVISGGKSDYNPIDEAEIKQSELDYIAIGHKHTYSGIVESGSTYWAYSGNPEGRGFDEVGNKGVIIGTVGKSCVDLRFEETCKRKYIVKTIDITGAANYEDIVIKINEKLGLHLLDGHIQSKIEFCQENLFKFILTGEVDKEFYINSSVIYEKLKKDFFYVKIVDNSHQVMDIDSIINDFSLDSVFIKKMKERLSESKDTEKSKIIEEALRIGLKCLQGREVIFDDN